MSGGACAVIIGDGEKLKAEAQQVVNLWSMEMQRLCTFSDEARAAYHARIRKALEIIQVANGALVNAMGPPHDAEVLQKLQRDVGQCRDRLDTLSGANWKGGPR